ncbi:MAG: TolC family protein [Acidobacteria bacterium]|nr:TolC family protein [Acidobacteriota bacterium]
MKTTALLSLTLLLGFAALPAGGAEPLTLKQAIATALQKNPAVRAASAAEAQAAARLIEARSNYFPKVNYLEQFQQPTPAVF